MFPGQARQTRPNSGGVADPANNGKPFRFRIGSVKSAQLFQLSAENFFRLRYEIVPLQ